MIWPWQHSAIDPKFIRVKKMLFDIQDYVKTINKTPFYCITWYYAVALKHFIKPFLIELFYARSCALVQFSTIIQRLELNISEIWEIILTFYCIPLG